MAYRASASSGTITCPPPRFFARARARWFDSSLECHDGEFEVTVRPPEPDPADTPLRTPRENWDFDPQAEGVPSLDVRRGGFLELEWAGP